MAGTFSLIRRGARGTEDGSRPWVGAIAGALLVPLLVWVVGGLLSEVAGPLMLVACALVGALLGAFAWGAVAYERDHRSPPARAG